MEDKHKKDRRKRRNYGNPNHIYNHTQIDNSKYVKIFIVLSIYVFIIYLVYNLLN